MQLNEISEQILLVFEGEKTEFKIHSFLKQHNLSLSNADREILTTFKAEIYQLYKQVIENEVDLLAILQERDENLQKVSLDNISSVFLIFDYDSHATQAEDDKIKELLIFFDNETENGKIFISYPMVEAFKFFDACDNLDDFCLLTIERENVKNFKMISHQLCSKQHKTWQRMTRQDYQHLIKFHCIKSNWITNSDKTIPTKIIPQSNIFSEQEKSDDIYIISAFPLIFHYFYKKEEFQKLISD